MMKIIKSLAIIIILATLLLLQGLYLLFNTELGLKSAIIISRHLLPGTLTIEASSGTLSKGILLKKIHYQYLGTDMQIQSLQMKWQPSQYFRKRYLQVDELALSNVSVVIKSTDEVENKQALTMNAFFNQLKQLNKLHLGHATLDTATITLDDKHIQLQQVEIINKQDGQYDFSMMLNQGKVTGHYQVNWQPLFSWQLTVIGNKVNPGGLVFNQSGAINFKLSSQGRWQDQQKAWTLKLDELTGALHGYPVSGSASILFDRDAWHVNQFHIQVADANFKAQGLLEKPHTNLNWLIDIPHLNEINPSYHGMLHVEGNILQTGNVLKASASLRGQQLIMPWLKANKLTGDLSADVTAQMAQIKLNGQRVNVSGVDLPNINLNVASAWSNIDLVSDFMMNLQDGNVIGGRITLPGVMTGSTAKQKLSGKINLNILQPERFIATKRLREFTGRLTGVINLQGTLKAPEYIANVMLTDGSFYVRELGIRPSHINLKGIMQRNGPFTVEGSFISGDGTGHISGEINLFQHELPLKLHLTGNQLQTMQLKEYNITSSPNLTIINNGDHFDIEGEVTIPFLEIKTDEINDALTLPAEVEFVHKQQAKSTFPTQLVMRIRLILGDHIVLSTKDLHATVSGNIVVTQTLGGLPSGAGSFQIITGTYEVYNQLLNISEGRLIYIGNLLNNPGLDIRAWKTVNSTRSTSIFNKLVGAEDKNAVKVGASIRGTLENPQIELISDPPMNQDDILAYLAFGFSQNNLTTAGLAVLGSIASGLNLSNPNLSDAGDISNAAGQKNVFKVGLLNSVQALHFRRNIGRRWAIETEASPVETGVDLIYIYQSH